ncbi:MAG: hypothetical protein FLDDKLPJ_01761 [Phycisphaerae bacterium]|nr:hypothetical protein [Phycisphaerae bacterium]
MTHEEGVPGTGALEAGSARVGPGESFYVGYLKMPGALRRFVMRVLAGLLALTGGTALFLSLSQNDPGDGVWADEAAPTMIGRIEAAPYPLIRVLTNDPDRPVATMLLVEEGKRGGGDGVRALDGRMAGVRGTLLQRDSVKLIELSPDGSKPDASRSETEIARLSVLQRESLGTVTLRGEIIDPKCYCGAMKPGEGKPHKACATLCISGGIPPMFVTIDADGKRSYYLLCNHEGLALDARILPFVADPVEITGTLERRDDLTLFKINPADIQRL